MSGLMRDAPIICPRCHTRIDPTGRCEEQRGAGRCMELQGHDGFHWSDVGSGDGSVLIWHGPYRHRSCAGRLSLDRWCQKSPGHTGAHNDGNGVTFSDPIDEDDER